MSYVCEVAGCSFRHESAWEVADHMGEVHGLEPSGGIFHAMGKELAEKSMKSALTGDR